MCKIVKNLVNKKLKQLQDKRESWRKTNNKNKTENKHKFQVKELIQMAQ